MCAHHLHTKSINYHQTQREPCAAVRRNKKQRRRISLVDASENKNDTNLCASKGVCFLKELNIHPNAVPGAG
jgi:hypothetical protein